MDQPPANANDYRCPGEHYPISRPVHLGRLARYWPACRQCPHRDDHEPLSPRQVRRLREVRRRAEIPQLFHDEGVVATTWNELKPSDARKLAAAVGAWLQRQPDSASPPTALVAGDGRPLTPELLSAVVEGFRWTGCHTIEIPAATAPCAALAVSHLACDGGILIGNPTDGAKSVGLKFWGPEGRPLSQGAGLESVETVFRQGLDRPTRRYGSLRRVQAETPYLAALVDQYHGLRPLRIVLRNNCLPLGRYLGMLLAPTACQLFNCQGAIEHLVDETQQQQAHLALDVQDDGQRCEVYDERGELIAPAAVARLVIGELSAQTPDAHVILDRAIAASFDGKAGGSVRLNTCEPGNRAALRKILETQDAIFAAQSSGQFWYRLGPSCWAPDALWTLTLLLRHLSRSDRPLSAVLDGPARGN